MEDFLVGSSEARSRVMGWKSEKSTDRAGVEYPSATNNRGFAGRREKHDYGDMVGQDDVMQGPQNHAHGESVSSAMPSQGGCHQNAKSRNPGSNMPSQGGHHMGNMSGDMSAPRSKGSRRETHSHGESVGPEHHSWGNMVKGAFNSVKQGATNMANQGMNQAKAGANRLNNQAQGYVQNQGNKLANNAQSYAKGQANYLGSQAKNYASQQLGNASQSLAGQPMNNPNPYRTGGHVEREEHSFGSFVKGAKSAAKSAGRGITSAAKTAGHGIASGAKTVGKAAAPYVKKAAGQAMKQGIKNAMSGAEESAMKRGGRAERREHMGRDRYDD